MIKHSPEQKPSTHELTDEDLSNVTGGMFDAYLQIDGIKGEAQEDRHKDWIEVLSYSHKVAQPGKGRT
jgi:bacteriocin-like protein